MFEEWSVYKDPSALAPPEKSLLSSVLVICVHLLMHTLSLSTGLCLQVYRYKADNCSEEVDSSYPQAGTLPGPC